MGDASEKKIKPLVPLPQQPASEAPKGERLEVASKGKEPVVSTNQYKPDATSNKPVRKETHVISVRDHHYDQSHRFSIRIPGWLSDAEKGSSRTHIAYQLVVREFFDTNSYMEWHVTQRYRSAQIV